MSVKRFQSRGEPLRIQSSLLRGGLLCGLSLGVWLVGIPPAAAEVTLLERNGFTFFTDGRVNAFFSQGIGDAFPQPSPNPNVNAAGVPGPDHGVLGSGQPFTAGYDSFQNGATGKYNAERIRSGFLASIIAFGVKHHISETTTIKSYISLWETAETYARDRVQDTGLSTTKGFDVREGYVDVEGPWGSLIAGRQGGIFGHIGTEIDFLYGHNYGLGLPCVDDFYATCGHVGTGVLGAGVSAGFVYSTPDFRGLRLTVGIFDPVRLLGQWERVPTPRPEGT